MFLVAMVSVWELRPTASSRPRGLKTREHKRFYHEDRSLCRCATAPSVESLPFLAGNSLSNAELLEYVEKAAPTASSSSSSLSDLDPSARETQAGRCETSRRGEVCSPLLRACGLAVPDALLVSRGTVGWLFSASLSDLDSSSDQGFLFLAFLAGVPLAAGAFLTRGAPATPFVYIHVNAASLHRWHRSLASEEGNSSLKDAIGEEAASSPPFSSSSASSSSSEKSNVYLGLEAGRREQSACHGGF
ncbi:hypothetical protein EYF80_010662 [Liparis tanakae]|uniref:Uncharacterized protein n=1 Tax=Liparis tanakae TaxID=230148 RepID=A0A4Z2IP83_9TELE|nr:hypothetical protein EYF80_010662 [Liparis tanakae]